MRPFDRSGGFLRGNLHAHTTESDGHVAPDELLRRFRSQGYDFVALTDHHRLTTPASAPDGLVWIPGQECHPGVNALGEAHHILAVGLRRPVDSTRGDSPQACLDEIREAGGVAYMAHPYWHGTGSEEILALEGWTGIEVFNATCEVTLCRGDSSVVWDEILSAGRSCSAIAVDDCHRAEVDVFRGWVWVRAERNTREAIMEALREGDYYSSTGPTIQSVVEDDGKLVIRTSPARVISLIGRGASGSYAQAPPGGSITEAALDPSRTKGYRRLVVLGADGGTAWTNPVMTGE